jgi:aromatic ring-opening dioxygenase catalytic subunit (LigB family)
MRRHFDRLEMSLKAILPELPLRPRAILMVSGHWETPAFRLSSAERPGMLYDYQGFPPHTYTIRYPAPGDPALAETAAALLSRAGLDAGLDPERGLDHGTFSLLQVMRPEADLPVVQLSIQQDFDPARHIKAGRALAPLRADGVLIIGSGLSYHNLRAFGPAGGEASHAFDAWLRQSLVGASPPDRASALMDWEAAPAARRAHPREDHLLPLMVAAGAAEEDPCTTAYHQSDFFGALSVTSFRFGPVP